MSSSAPHAVWEAVWLWERATASKASSVGPRSWWTRRVLPLASSPQRPWLANQEKKLRGRGAWWTRTVRGERHALMVASSLAVSKSSCSWGLKTTELTTSWCRSLARQML